MSQTDSQFAGGPLELLNFEVRVYRVGNQSTHRGDADHILPGSAVVGETKISDRLQEWAGSATLSWQSMNGDHAGAITTGDRVELVYDVLATGQGTPAGGATYGEATFGDASFGSAGTEGSLTYRWTGKAQTPSFEIVHADPNTEIGRYEVELDEYVFGILADRVIYGAFEGDVGDIVTDVIEARAPEIRTHQVEHIGVETDREYDGRNLKEIVVEMAEIGDCVLSSADRTLTFKPLGDISPQFELADEDFGGLSCDGDSTSLTTKVRVDGGTDINLDEQTAIDEDDIFGYERVTETDRLTYQLDPEKSRLDRVDVWIRDTGSGEGVRVRIQASNRAGTAPRDEDDTTVDVVADASGVALPEDGWRRRFRLQREVLPPDPWLIIESTGLEGQDIGVNIDDDPAFRTYYPYDIAVEVTAQEEIDRYGLVEHVYTDDSLVSFQSARDIGDANLAHNKHPNRELSFDATRFRTHDLRDGQVITLAYPQYDLTDQWIVTDREQRIRGTDVRTDLTLQSVESL